MPGAGYRQAEMNALAVLQALGELSTLRVVGVVAKGLDGPRAVR